MVVFGSPPNLVFYRDNFLYVVYNAEIFLVNLKFIDDVLKNLKHAPNTLAISKIYISMVHFISDMLGCVSQDNA